jgi:translation initiation factor 2 beta subunit (eIF-2beta)/eIF-5
MAEKTEQIKRIEFLEVENKKLAEEREKLVLERRSNEEKRWHSLEKGLATVNSNVSELRNEVRTNVQELRTEVRAAHQSAANFQAVAEEMKKDRERTTLILTGGDHPETGLMFRTKQVEDDHKEHVEDQKESRKWWLGLGAVAVVTFFKTIWDMITGHKA